MDPLYRTKSLQLRRVSSDHGIFGNVCPNRTAGQNGLAELSQRRSLFDKPRSRTSSRLSISSGRTFLSGVFGSKERLSSHCNSAQLRPTAPSFTLHGQFARTFVTLPEIHSQPAVRFGSRTITFTQLSRLSDYVMALLRSRVKPESSNPKIAVLMEPCLELTPILLGILKLGGAILPINPIWTSEKIATVLEENDSQAFISDDLERFHGSSFRFEILDAHMFLVVAAEFFGSHKANRAVGPCQETSPAVIIYGENRYATSHPAAVSHQLVFNRITAHWDKLPFRETECLVSRSPVWIVDMYVEIFQALLAGRCVNILTKMDLVDMAHFAEVLEKNPVHRLFLDISEFEDLCETLEKRPLQNSAALELVMLTGTKSISVDLAENFFGIAPHCRLGHAYSLPELAGAICWYLFESKEDLQTHSRRGTLSFGVPIQHFALKIVDESGGEVPDGDIGELLVEPTFLDLDSAESSSYGSENGNDQARVVRTGDMAFVDPETRLLYVLPKVSEGKKADGFAEEETQPEVIPAAVVVPVLCCPSLTEELLSQALEFIISGTLASAGSEALSTGKALELYARTLVNGLQPQELVFVSTDEFGRPIGFGLAYDPFVTTDDAKGLMLSHEDAGQVQILSLVAPLLLTLPQNPGVFCESYLMAVSDSLVSPEAKFSVLCQMDEELVKRATEIGYQYIVSRNYDCLTQSVAEARGYQRWAAFQMNRICLPSGVRPFLHKPDSARVTLDVLSLLAVVDAEQQRSY